MNVDPFFPTENQAPRLQFFSKTSSDKVCFFFRVYPINQATPPRF